MSINLSEMAAVATAEGQPILGYITWYSVGEALVSTSSLRQKLIRSGLGDGYMPEPIRIPDAFRRATNIKEKRKTEKSEVVKNYLCREVSSDKKYVQRNIVIETVDSKGRKLQYDDKAAILVLDKENESVNYSAIDPTAEEMAAEATRLFDLYRNHYNSQTIRTVVQTVIKSMSPTPVRPSGGIYFIPQRYENKLENFCSFLRLMDKSEGWMIPMINQKDNIQLVRQKLTEHLQNTLHRCKSTMNGKLLKGQVKEIIEEAKRVVTDFKDYTSLVSDNIQQMESLVASIREEVHCITEKFWSNKTEQNND